MNELLIWIVALLIFIGIPVFCISKRKMKKRGQKWIYIKAAFYGLLSAFSIPILIMILVLCVTIKNDHFPPKKTFNKEKWTDTLSDDRYKYSRDIIDSQLLNNKTAVEVIEVLDNKFIIAHDSTRIIYFTGYQPSYMTHIPRTLEVYFKNGKVIRVTMNRTSRSVIDNYLLHQ